MAGKVKINRTKTYFPFITTFTVTTGYSLGSLVLHHKLALEVFKQSPNYISLLSHRKYLLMTFLNISITFNNLSINMLHVKNIIHFTT